MARDGDALAEQDRRLIIDRARTVAALDLWIRNGGRPPEADAAAADGVERGPRRGKAGETAMDAVLDQIVGFRADGSPVPRTFERERGPRERGPRERGPAERIRRVAEHFQPGTLYEWTFYPEHDARGDSDTAAYRSARKKLVENGACLVCGVSQATLKDPIARKDLAKNPFEASGLETHHRVIEWALSEAIDVDRFNSRFVARRRLLDPTDEKYARDFDQKTLLDWIDHDPDNLWVLCNVHHRAPFMGIHAITRPHWDPQDLVFPKFWNRTPPADQDPRKKKPAKPNKPGPSL